MSETVVRDTSDGEDGGLPEFAALVAADLELLSILHDKEPSEPVLRALRACPLEQQLGVVPSGPDAQTAFAALTLSLDDLPDPIDQAALDELASGYADVYLRHTYRASPEESVWLTEDGLQRQQPMFVIREAYRRSNLKAADWASRPDDHIVLQLKFVAHLLRDARQASDFALPTRFLDEHLLLWIKPFASRLIDAGAPDYYAAVALITAIYLADLRTYLGEITGIAIPKPKEIIETPKPDKESAERPYFPGAAPSW